MGQAWDNDKTIHVDMSTLKVTIKDFREEWKLLGGRALSAKVMLEECNPKCDPLGPENVLVFAPGTMSGTAAPTSGRISMGCKSPLTGGIKEANAGGNPGQDLMKIGYRAVIVTGQPADRNKLWGLRVSDGNAELVDATEYKGMWNYACCEKLLDGESDKASVISIGPAGEMMLKGASIACTDSDKDRRPARQAARGGVGAVMGSKCLKWVLVALLVGAGIYGNSYLSDESLLYRVIGLLVVAAVALAVAVTTARGDSAWTMVKGARTEIRKVIWPTRQETTQTTMIVMVFVVVCGLFFWALDSVLGWLFSLLLV